MAQHVLRRAKKRLSIRFGNRDFRMAGELRHLSVETAPDTDERA